MKQVTLGFVPTRRNIFSAPAAVEYADLTRKRLEQLGVRFVDVTGINPEGLFYDEADRAAVSRRFREAHVDGLLIAHCNFGTEYVCARLARELNVPVLLWGPRDECPDENGVRLRDSQCGLFATGKVLRRFGVPFSYLSNCRLEDPAFEQGLMAFLAVCNVVRTFRNIRILQIGPRPFDFWSTMCNEGELLERFHIQLAPIPLPELKQEVQRALADGDDVQQVVDYCHAHMNICVTEEELRTIAAMKVAIRRLADRYGCSAAAIQCWNALQTELGVMPCAANSLLNEEGFPVVCETDIHGAITALLAEAACLDDTRSFFADWTVRHPENDNAELLQHCGPWPISVADEKPSICYPLAFSYPGAVAARAKKGKLTICRFDGDNGEYSLLLGNARGVDGPATKGTYMWVEVDNWPRLEEKIVEGPYIHHCVGIHKDVVPVLYEACRYMGIRCDLYDPIEEQAKAYLRGE